ncbi:MAG: hypothetical protein KC684_04020 [Candidatus Omnitrophica bacterium]|nr:hypothetical protein [Candidatus Omnitrophota bacterium]
MKKCFIIIVSSFLILSICDIVHAKSIEEYFSTIKHLMRQGRFMDAHGEVQLGLKEYPDHPGLIYALSDTYYYLGYFEYAIQNYLVLLDFMIENGRADSEIARTHFKLADSYNELGQQRYFSKELCLRIIYHIERFLELYPESQHVAQYRNIQKKVLDYYDNSLPNLKFMEKDKNEPVFLSSSEEFKLPEDIVSEAVKLEYLEKFRKEYK